MNLVSVTCWKKITVALCIFGLLSPLVWAQKIEQAKVEAAIALRLLAFVEWPESHEGEDNREIVIGVYEEGSLLVEFENIIERFSSNVTYRAVLIDEYSSQEDLSAIDAIYFGGEERVSITRSLRRVEGFPILLMGNFEGFLEMGGMVNFVKKQKKITFDIDLENSRKEGIAYRAKLLRLANRVVGK